MVSLVFTEANILGIEINFIQTLGGFALLYHSIAITVTAWNSIPKIPWYWWPPRTCQVSFRIQSVLTYKLMSLSLIFQIPLENYFQAKRKTKLREEALRRLPPSAVISVWEMPFANTIMPRFLMLLLLRKLEGKYFGLPTRKMLLDATLYWLRITALVSDFTTRMAQQEWCSLYWFCETNLCLTKYCGS